MTIASRRGWARALYEALGKIAEKAIIRFASEKKLETSIGGPISIIKIDKSGVHYMQNEPIHFHWTRFLDFIADYYNHRIHLNFATPEKQKSFDLFLKKIKQLVRFAAQRTFESPPRSNSHSNLCMVNNQCPEIGSIKIPQSLLQFT
jgi:hypothetical protein